MQVRRYLGLGLLLLVVIFIVQNAAVVDIRFLIWELSMPRALMILLVLAAGFAIGWFSSSRD